MAAENIKLTGKNLGINNKNFENKINYQLINITPRGLLTNFMLIFCMILNIIAIA